MLTNNGPATGANQTRCELPTAVHIAQISSSDEDYLDFEEADDFNIEDESTQVSAAGLPCHQNQQKSFLGSK